MKHWTQLQVTGGEFVIRPREGGDVSLHELSGSCGDPVAVAPPREPDLDPGMVNPGNGTRSAPSPGTDRPRTRCGRPDTLAAWYEALAALGPAGRPDVRGMPDGGCCTYPVETAWAPHYVEDELRQARAAASSDEVQGNPANRGFSAVSAEKDGRPPERLAGRALMPNRVR